MIEQHAELATTLWARRRDLADDEGASFQDLRRFDDRLRGNLDGLLLAGEAGRTLAQDVWSEPGADPGFGRAFLAIAHAESEGLADLAADVSTHRSLASALGFSSREDAGRALSLFAQSTDAPARRAAARGSRALRRTEGLASLVEDADAGTRLLAIEAVGLARQAAPRVLASLRVEAEAGQPLAHWALWMLQGRESDLWQMLDFGEFDIGLAILACRQASPQVLSEKIAPWRRTANRRRTAIILAVALGAPTNVGWIAEELGDPEHAEIAGYAVRAITGADVARLPSEAELASGASRVQDWAAASKHRFRSDARYIEGVEITDRGLDRLLRQGLQGVRVQAAFEAAASRPGVPVLNTRAPSDAQLGDLTGWRSR